MTSFVGSQAGRQEGGLKISISERRHVRSVVIPDPPSSPLSPAEAGGKGSPGNGAPAGRGTMPVCRLSVCRSEASELSNCFVEKGACCICRDLAAHQPAPSSQCTTAHVQNPDNKDQQATSASTTQTARSCRRTAHPLPNGSS